MYSLIVEINTHDIIATLCKEQAISTEAAWRIENGQFCIQKREVLRNEP